VSDPTGRAGHPLLGGRLLRSVRLSEGDHPSLAPQLSRLKELRVRNLITDLEYHRARRRLLD
jgi:hypothetical protein